MVFPLLPTIREGRDTECLNYDVATSLALYTYLAISIGMCVKSSVAFFMSALANVAQCVASHIDGASSQVDLGTRLITIDSDGQVSGFRDCLSHVRPMPVAQSLLREPSP